MAPKTEVRKEGFRKRSEIDKKELEIKSRIVCEKLMEIIADHGNVMLYSPAGKELDVTPAIQSCLSGGKRVFLPYVHEGRIGISEIKKYPEDTREGTFGIREPAEKQNADPAILDAVVVPGISFDRRGFRVGHGHGYYDRFLKNLAAKKIGVCFGFQVVQKIAETDSDVRMDMVISDEELL